VHAGSFPTSLSSSRSGDYGLAARSAPPSPAAELGALDSSWLVEQNTRFVLRIADRRVLVVNGSSAENLTGAAQLSQRVTERKPSSRPCKEA
jgi:hypothetical protein